MKNIELLNRFQLPKGLVSLEGKTALITGASSGLGREFARILGAANVNLILTARTKNKLEALKEELSENAEITIDVIPLDLSKATAAKKLFDEIKALDRDVDVLINNAGVGVHGSFSATSLAKLESMVQLNVNSLMKLSHLFLPQMLLKKDGYILQVASVAGFMPLSNYSIYAASKAFVLSFSQSLNWELEGTGVSSTALCPGATKTSFFEAAGHHTNKLVQATMMSSEEVARAGLKAMLRREEKFIPGVVNKVTVGVTSALPDSVNRKISSEFMK